MIVIRGKAVRAFHVERLIGRERNTLQRGHPIGLPRQHYWLLSISRALVRSISYYILETHLHLHLYPHLSYSLLLPKTLNFYSHGTESSRQMGGWDRVIPLQFSVFNHCWHKLRPLINFCIMATLKFVSYGLAYSISHGGFLGMYSLYPNI